jgi:uncharacterized protein
MIERKSFKLEVKDISEEGSFDGYASTFGNVDLGNDIVAKGAFAQTIKVNGGVVPILDSHDPSKQIGWNESALEDSKGLKVHGRLDMNIQKARERHSLMRTAKSLGASMGLSIGYMTVKWMPHKERPEVRVLKELNLMEYSVVTFPMNPKASVTAVKTIDGITIEEIKMYLMHDKGISEKAALMACDMLQSYATIEQGSISHSGQEQIEHDYSDIGKALENLAKSFSY